MVAAAHPVAASYQPLGDNVLIEELPHEQGILVIPDGADVGPTTGKVIAVGPGRYDYGGRVPMDVEVGDTVYMFGDQPFIKLPLGGKEYALIRAIFLKMKVK